MQKILAQIAAELGVRPAQVAAAVDLLDGGATVPFIARYRKEATGTLDDIQLRELESRLAYLRELEQRRTAVCQSIEEQGKLTPALRAAIEAAPTKQELEDLYLPYKQKRRTKALIAREAGLAPLAERLFGDPALAPLPEARAFMAAAEGGAAALAAAGFADEQALLDGVRDILCERWAEDAALVQGLRGWLWAEGLFQSRLAAGKNELDPDVARFRDYFAYEEAIARVPSHRALAVFRGRALELLDVKLALPEAAALAAGAARTAALPAGAARTVALPAVSLAEGRIALHLGWSHRQRAGDDFIRKCVAWAWKVKLSLSLERDLFARLREAAEQVAIKVFAENLRDLLLAAPAGRRVVMGLDPGIRTGVKVAVVSDTGKLLDTATVFPHEPRHDWDGALHTLARLAAAHGVNLVATGNGTASRETDKLAGELIKRLQAGPGKPPEADVPGGANAPGSAALAPPEPEGTAVLRLAIEKLVVSEAGASVYSASEFASKELPGLDVTLRGAVSIARRVQDPLAELVKIDPKSIGVGQYQHDVNQAALARMLATVVEDCVNAVGVDVNTASAPLLARVSGLSATVAENIVARRDGQGAFRNRRQLREVAGLGEKSFEQAAGFLRIWGGDNPLDHSGVHPETYPLVEKILAAAGGRPLRELMGRTDLLRSLEPKQFADDRYGLITVGDVLAELEKPARDPRPDFKVARLSEGVEAISDLRAGMLLEGTVSNVAAFGAFVDLGVHQDGLVHVSQLADKFIKDAREVVKTGDIVKVRVVEVDLARKRIALSMKLDAVEPRGSRADGNVFRAAGASERPRGPARPDSPQTRNQPQASGSAMADAFAKLQRR